MKRLEFTPNRRWTWIMAAALALSWGCVERSIELTQAEREELGGLIGSEKPKPPHKLDISFENKVVLLGYDIDVKKVTPGKAFTVTWYWRSKRALDEGWLLFTHVADGAGTNRLNSDGESTVRRLYQPGRWKAGEYVNDVQRLTLPADWNSDRAIFYVGVWNGPHRLQILRGPNDGENRARAASVPVDASVAPGTDSETELPELQAHKLEGSIQLDGELKEPAWRTTPATSAFVHTLNGGAAEPRTTARVLWDDSNLYVGVEVRDDFLKSKFSQHDDHLWAEDCVELMVDPDGDGRNYFEMQVSPRGVVFDTRYDERRVPGPYGHKDWNSGLRAKAKTKGTVNDDVVDEGYTVEFAVPWSAFSAGSKPAAKPSPQDVWRLNLFVMDARKDGAPRAAAWSAPRVGDFHILSKFGQVRFVEPSPEPKAQPQLPAGATPPPTGQARLPAAALEAARRQMRVRPAEVGQPGPAQPTAGEAVPGPAKKPATPRPPSGAE